ncbi:MAG: hypothetical protein AB1714_04460 [Acidobacteriota bacterium]
MAERRNRLPEVEDPRAWLLAVTHRAAVGEAYPQTPTVVSTSGDRLREFAGVYEMGGDAGRFRVAVEGLAPTIEPQGHRAFSMLHSSADAEPGRFDRLKRLMGEIISNNMVGNFKSQFDACGGRVTIERLRDRWREITSIIEAENGTIVKFDILGTARRTQRDETIVRFTCERGFVYMTYVCEAEKGSSLLGMSMRGLPVSLKVVPTGDTTFASWDGGLRPSMAIEFRADERYRMTPVVDHVVAVRRSVPLSRG